MLAGDCIIFLIAKWLERFVCPLPNRHPGIIPVRYEQMVSLFALGWKTMVGARYQKIWDQFRQFRPICIWHIVELIVLRFASAEAHAHANRKSYFWILGP